VNPRIVKVSGNRHQVILPETCSLKPFSAAWLILYETRSRRRAHA
jgi:hypothetical protein